MPDSAGGTPTLAGHDLENSADRNCDPVRSIIHFITDFVDCFIEDKCLEQHLKILRIRGYERATFGRVQIALQEHPADGLRPMLRPWTKLGDILGAPACILRQT